MDDDAARCWLCGREVEHREASLLPHSGIPIHRECLEEGGRCYADTPLAEPGDVIYFAPTLFRT